MSHIWSHGVVLHLGMVLAPNETMLSIDVVMGLLMLGQMLTSNRAHLDSVVIQPLALNNRSVVRLMLWVQLKFNWIRLDSATSCGRT